MSTNRTPRRPDMLDLPIGMLPGTVPDDPSIGKGATAPAAHEHEHRRVAVSGRELALRIAHHLAELVNLGHEQQRISESSRRNFLQAGTLSLGGTIGTAPAPLLNANSNRRGLSIQNLGTAGSLTLGLGQTAPQVNTGITLQPGQTWDGRVSGALWVGSVYIVGTQAGVQWSALEA